MAGTLSQPGAVGAGTLWGCTGDCGGRPPARAPCPRTGSWRVTPGGTRDPARSGKARREHACRGRPWLAGCPYWTDSRSSWPRGTRETPLGPLVLRRGWHRHCVTPVAGTPRIKPRSWGRALCTHRRPQGNVLCAKLRKAALECVARPGTGRVKPRAHSRPLFLRVHAARDPYLRAWPCGSPVPAKTYRSKRHSGPSQAGA